MTTDKLTVTAEKGSENKGWGQAPYFTDLKFSDGFSWRTILPEPHAEALIAALAPKGEATPTAPEGVEKLVMELEQALGSTWSGHVADADFARLNTARATLLSAFTLLQQEIATLKAAPAKADPYYPQGTIREYDASGKLTRTANPEFYKITRREEWAGDKFEAPGVESERPIRPSLEEAIPELLNLAQGADHDDSDCPGDDTCRCENIAKLNAELKAVEGSFNPGARK